MRDKHGKSANMLETQMMVALLRNERRFSFAEIARQLKLKSRQLARYHYKQWQKMKIEDKKFSTASGLDKDL